MDLLMIDYFWYFVNTKIIILVDGHIELYNVEVNELQEEDDDSVLQEDEIERETITKKLQLFRIFTQGNWFFVYCPQAADTFRTLLFFSGDTWFCGFSMLMRELPIWVQRLHVEVFLDVLLHVVVMIVVVMMVRMMMLVLSKFLMRQLMFVLMFFFMFPRERSVWEGRKSLFGGGNFFTLVRSLSVAIFDWKMLTAHNKIMIRIF